MTSRGDGDALPRPPAGSADRAPQEMPILPRYGLDADFARSPLDVSLQATEVLPAIGRHTDSRRLPAVPRGGRVGVVDPFDLALQPTLILPAIPAAAAAPSTGALVRGAALLLAREGLLKIVVLAANVILARLLAPRDFGVFTILAFFTTFLSTFGTFGLAASIVQRTQPPSRRELAALFTFQVAIGGTLALVAEGVAPLLSAAYGLDDGGKWLIRAMAIGFLLTSAAATPTALLERRLAFGRVAVIEVATGLAYQVVAIALALSGFGVWSLVVATLGSTMLNAFMAFATAGWWPSLSLLWRPILPMVRFGLQFQAVNVVALIKDSTIPTFVAAALGAEAVGYIDWATTLAFYPLILVAIIGRVTFPVYSRLASDRPRLQEVIEATLRAQAYAIFPAVAALAALAPAITRIVFTERWLPGVPLIYFLLVSTIAACVSSALTAALNALGKPQVVLRLMFMWLILGWATAVPLVLWLGILGYAIANAIVASTVVVTVYAFKRYQPIRVLRNVSLPLVAAGVAGGTSYGLSQWAQPITPALLIGEMAATLAAFVLVEAAADRRFRGDVRALARMIFARPYGTPAPAKGLVAGEGLAASRRPREAPGEGRGPRAWR